MGWLLEAANSADRETFVARLGGIFEHSPWVAEAVVAARPFPTVEALHTAMSDAARAAPLPLKLELIRAHPDLAGKAARRGDMTDESVSEQAGAGLDQLSEDEYRRFDRLNTAYRDRFDMPFIIAVKGHDTHSILASFEERLCNEAEAEIDTAIEQICRIAGFRLGALLAETGEVP